MDQNHGTVRQRLSGLFQTQVTVGSNPSRATQPSRDTAMNSNTQFSIQLANGKEQCFASAAEMNAWLTKQRGLRSPAQRREKAERQRHRGKTNGQENVVKEQSDERPLARYANRYSGEA